MVKKYGSNAERQRAYRERLKQRQEAHTELSEHDRNSIIELLTMYEKATARPKQKQEAQRLIKLLKPTAA